MRKLGAMEATYRALDLNCYVRSCSDCRAVGGETDFDSLCSRVADEERGEETEECKFHHFMSRTSGGCWVLECLIVANL